ncbi:hypothetical protein [Flavilitoribacter nigricans]|nr:hypothetical protein [Flavilitoribacter nigricans]
MAVALKFVMRSGEQKAVHYHDILSPIEYDGNALITLYTSRLTIRIEGQYLGALFDYIIQHRVKSIEEPQSTFPSEGPGKLAVNSILFEDPE